MNDAAVVLPESKIDIVHRLQQVIARKDLAAFLGFFAPHVEYHYHVGSRPLMGVEWVEKFIVKYWKNNHDGAWVIVRHAECGNAILMEGREEYLNADGQKVVHPYMGVIEFEDGKIVAWRDYFQMNDPNAGK